MCTGGRCGSGSEREREREREREERREKRERIGLVKNEFMKIRNEGVSESSR